MLSVELLSIITQGIIGFLLAYFAYDFMTEFKRLRESVVALNASIQLIVFRLEHVESDHGRRIEKLESEVL